MPQAVILLNFSRFGIFGIFLRFRQFVPFSAIAAANSAFAANAGLYLVLFHAYMGEGGKGGFTPRKYQNANAPDPQI